MTCLIRTPIWIMKSRTAKEIGAGKDLEGEEEVVTILLVLPGVEEALAEDVEKRIQRQQRPTSIPSTVTATNRLLVNGHQDGEADNHKTVRHRR